MTRVAGAAAALACVLGLGACGGGGGDESGGTADAEGDARAAVVSFNRTGNCDLLTAHGRKALTGQTDAGRCQAINDNAPKTTMTGVTATVGGGDDDRATVTGTTAGNTYTFTLVKDDDGWLIDDVSDPNGVRGDAKAQRQFAAAFKAAGEEAAQFTTTLRAHATDHDVPAIRTAVATERDALMTFDGKVRAITFEAGARDELATLLTLNRRTIAALDAMARAKTFGEISQLSQQRLGSNFALLARAAQALEAAA